MVALHVAGDATTRAHIADRVDEYWWVGSDGMKAQGFNSSALWDTAFIVQALVTTPREIASRYDGTLRAASDFVAATQLRDRVLPAFRAPIDGAWTFSTPCTGWAAIDTTAEGLKAALVAPTAVRLPRERLRATVDLLLRLQHRDSGGWAPFEDVRGAPWYELLNPGAFCGEVMVEWPVVEVTASAVTALHAFRRQDPHYRGRCVCWIAAWSAIAASQLCG